MEDRNELLASIGRLITAGIVESSAYDDASDLGELRWTPSFLRLLLAGRQVMREPGFQRVWATSDPLVIRAWIEHEASQLAAQPSDPPSGEPGNDTGTPPHRRPDE